MDDGPFGHDDASYFHVNNPLLEHYQALSPLQQNLPRAAIPFPVPHLHVHQHFFPEPIDQYWA
jgi:hypothetical protein